MPIKSQSKNKMLQSLCLQTKFLVATLLVFTLSQVVGLSTTSFAQKLDPYTGAPVKDSTSDDSSEKKTVINETDDNSNPSGSISEGYSFGQAEPDFYTLTGNGPENGNSPRRGNGGAGSWVRLGHLANKTIGRDESITHIELFPYLFNDHDGVLFGNLRFFRTNEGNWGGNGGVGYRKYLDRFDRFLGAALYFDRDGSRGQNFEQLTVSLESIGTNYDWRMNIHMPFGAERREIDNSFNAGSARFQDRNLVFDSTRTFANAYKGFDMELGFPLHNKLANKHDVRAYVGGYLFRDDVLNDIAGWKTRLAGNVVPSIDWNLELTRDNTFDTRIQFGASWTFNPHKSVAASRGRRKTTWERMTIPVERLHNVVTATQSILDPDQIAINPATGLPYLFNHVNSAAPGPGTGAVLDPFQTIQDAQAGPIHDIIFVHADSVFNGADAEVTALADIRLLGEGDGVMHEINVQGLGTINLPSATGGINRPVLNNSTGNGVTLESGSEFSGFVINNPTGDGIVADTITGATVRNVDVNTANGNGVVLNANTGSFLFSDVVVTNPVGNALQVTGGNAFISILDSVFTNNSNRLIVIDSITGGFVNLSATSNATVSTVTDNGGSGILVNNTAGTVTISGATVNNSSTTGIDIQDTIGTINFLGPTVIDGGVGNSFNIENTLVGSTISANGDLTINNRNMVGINLRNINGSVLIGDTTTINAPASGILSAIDFQNSSGTVQFQTLDINGSDGIGINIGEGATENTGAFTVLGATTISDTANTSLAIQNDSASITFNSLAINNRTLSGIVIDEYNGNAFFNQTTTVANELLSNSTALNISNTTTDGNITFATLSVANGLGDPAVDIQDNMGAIGLGNLNIETTGAIGLFADNNNDGTTTTLLSSSGGTISSTDATAVSISNSAIDMTFETINSTNSTFGIGLFNNTGSFRVLGLGTDVFGDGGVLSGHTAAGIFLTGTEANEEDYQFNELSIVQANEIGVRAIEIDNLEITITEILDSESQAIYTTNVENFLLEDSSILRNGDTNDTQSILKEVNRVLLDDSLDETFYVWDIFNSQISHDADNDAIMYQVIAGGQGAMVDASLGTIITNPDADQVVITTTADGFSGFRTEWDGIYFGDIHRTIFQSTGDDAFGILFDNNDLTDTADCPTAGCTNLVVQNSLFQMTGGNATGASFETSSFSLLDIISNQVDLTGGDSSIGMRFNLAPDSQVLLQDNIINDLVDEGTGFLFSPTNGPLSTVIQGNVISLNTTDFATFETAFNFQAVTGTVNLSGNADNVFNFGNSLARGLFGPFGSFNGQISINNVLVP